MFLQAVKRDSKRMCPKSTAKIMNRKPFGSVNSHVKWGWQRRGSARNQTSETKFLARHISFMALQLVASDVLCLGNGILMHLTCCCCCLRWTAVLVGPEVEISYVWGQSLLLQKGKEKNHCKIQDDIYVACENCSFLSSPVFRTGKFIPRRVLCTVQPFQCCTEIQNHFGMASGSSCCKSSGDWKPLNPLSLDPICLLTSLGPGVSLKLFDPSSLPWNCCIDFPWSAAKICFIQLGQRCLKTWLGSCESWAKCFPFCTSTCLRIGEISVDVSKLPGCWSFQSECLLQLGHEL